MPSSAVEVYNSNSASLTLFMGLLRDFVCKCAGRCVLKFIELHKQPTWKKPSLLLFLHLLLQLLSSSWSDIMMVPSFQKSKIFNFSIGEARLIGPMLFPFLLPLQFNTGHFQISSYLITSQAIRPRIAFSTRPILSNPYPFLSPLSL